MKNLSLFLLVTLPFMSIAQTPCDLVSVVSAQLDPFNPNNLLVTLDNQNEGEVFDYPGVRVYDAQDSLVGEYEVDLFGFFEATTFHMQHNLEGIIAGESFDLTIELWTGFYENLVCSWEESLVLLPTEGCADITLALMHMNSTDLADPFIFTVTDAADDVVASGAIPLDFGLDYQEDYFCLEAGCYNLNITTSDAVISSDVNYHILPNYYPEQTPTLSSIIEEGNIQADIQLDVWGGCGTTDVHKVSFDDLTIWPNPTQDVLNVQGNNWELIRIYDLFGSMVYEGRYVRSIDVESLAHGTYVITLSNNEGLITQRFVKQ